MRTKLTLSVFIMTLPLVGMLLYNNFYAIEVVRGQVAESYRNTLIHHMDLIDKDLNDIDAYMHTTGGSTSTNLTALGLAASENEYYMAKVFLFNKLIQDSTLFPSLGSFFVYVENRQDYMEVLTGSLPYQEQERIQQYIIDLIHKGSIPKGTNTRRWQYVQIGDKHYLLDIVQSGDTYLGAWVSSEQLLSSLSSLKMGEGAVLLASERYELVTNSDFIEDKGIILRDDPQHYYLSGSDEKYLVIGVPSIRGTFQLYSLISDNTILDKLPYLQRFIWLITFITLFFIPFGFYYMIRSFLVPLGYVLNAMKRVRSGDWSTRVELRNSSYEFTLLGNSFNAMMDEIQTLRVNVYEEQINKQREELQRLQLQINPHFFLNSLNIVYHLAKGKNYGLVMEMTMALIRYFRYLFRSNTSFLKLEDELEHTRNYLHIQTLRFPEKLTWKIVAPDYLAEVPIPPLVIQSFVENSIKHAVTMEEPIRIEIRIGYADENGSKINIRILDTGKGFPVEVLRKLQADKSVENDRGEHTGIWNVQRRLKLLYHAEDMIRFDNDSETGGALVVITLPTEVRKEGGV